MHELLMPRLRSVVKQLPLRPPSLLLALALDRLLLPRLDPEQRQTLSGRVLELELLEPGLRVRLLLTPGGFRAAPAGATPALTVRARSLALWQLLRGQEDADRLFFDRALVMEGDTEFGLVLKNTLDALGPLLEWGPRT